jgi:tetratricopeptide (TPR) repeat protein
VCSCGIVLWVSTAMGAAQTGASSGSIPVEQALSLAQKGRCKEALPILQKSAAHVSDKQIKYSILMASARCAMSLEKTESAVLSLLQLNREYPHDHEVLYVTTHFYSELAARASQELAATAPNAYQTEKLEAEAFESQGRWEEATTEYKRILDQNPGLPGIHYRLGRILSAKTPPATEDASKQFEQELKIDPSNASAEFMLGEIARQAGQWDDAIRHFARASKLDEGFVEAYLALGMSLNAAARFADAITPLQAYVKMQPSDPAGHYQLATAYSRTGHKEDASREMALQQKAAPQSPRESPPR